MPKNISDYSLAALERELDQEYDVGGSDETIMVRRSDNEYISDYSRDDYSPGYTVIRYSRRLRASTHLKWGVATFGLFLPFSLAADAAMRLGMGDHTHYFHTGNGDELGSSKGEAIGRASEVGEELMRKGRYEEASSYFNIAYFLCSDSRESGFRERRNAAADKAAAEKEKREREEREARERRERKAREARERRKQEEREARERRKLEARERREQEEREARERREQEARERREQEERERRERESREQEERERRERVARERERREREVRERRERERREQERREQEERMRREREARERERREWEVRERREREAREMETREREERERREQEVRERRVQESRERERREQQERERREQEARERETREQEAREMYQQAQELWTEAFSCENNNLAEEAEQKFLRSNELFSLATNLMPNVELYKNWHHISSLKLEGDSLFNEAVSLQEQGNRLRRKQKYEEAFAKYNEALTKYQEGFEVSRDTRFVACIEFVNSCITEIDEIIQEGDLEERFTNIQMETSGSEVNVEENANEDLIHCRILDS